MKWFERFFPKKPQEAKDLTVDHLKSASSWQQIFGAGLDQIMGGDNVNKPYEQVANVYKAVKAIADNVPQAELVFKDYKTEKEIEVPKLCSLFDNPNPLMTRNEFIQATAGYLSLYGECIILKTKSVGQAAGTSNIPAELWPVNPSKVTHKANANTITSWTYNSHEFMPDEVIFIKDFNPYNAFRGLAPTKVLEKIIQIDWSSLLYSKAFFENDATPGFMLTTDKPLTEVQRTRINEWINKKHQGASKAFRAMVLDNGITPKTIGSSAKDSELTEQRNFVREEILGVWRAPKALFNITDTLNYATFIGQMKIFWIYGIEPILRKLEDAFNKHLIALFDDQIYCEFDVSSVAAFQEDYKEKITYGKTLCDMGFTANEVNEKLKLGFEPKPWRDVSWINWAMVPADPFATRDPSTGKVSSAPDANADIASGKKPPKGKEDDDPLSASGDAMDAKGFEKSGKVWKHFVVRHEKIERAFDKKLQTYFFNQRKEVLSHIHIRIPKESPALNTKGIDISGMDWGAQDDMLRKMSSIFLMQAIQAGADYGVAVEDQANVDDKIAAKQEIMLQALTKRITGINVTIRRQLQGRVNDALQQGITDGLTMDQIGESVKESVRGFYNMADSRAKLIARTEVTAAMNGGNLLYLKAIGATGKVWVTANDESVRETHRQCQAQGEIGIDDYFSANDMQAPGAGDDPAEICNCRCSLKGTFN